MPKRKLTKIIILILLIIISNILIFKYANLNDSDIWLSFNVLSDNVDTYQVFYSDGNDWSEENSQKLEYESIGRKYELRFNIPSNTERLRFDIGTQVANIIISDIKLSYFGKEIQLDYNKFVNAENSSQISSNKKQDDLFISIQGNDPFIIYELDGLITRLLNYKNNFNFALKIALCIVIDLLLYLIIKKSRSVLILSQDLYNSRSLIWNLAKNDFKTKYAGSYLGIIWAFIQPIVTLLVYWIVFEFGLKAGSPTEGVPFILWFSVGLVPWFFFSDAINNAMNSLFEYSYLVKKVVFKISVLPIVKIISSIFVHFVFVSFVIVLASIYKYYPNIYFFQLPYYIFCTFFIVLAISYATSAVVLFFKDLGQIISIMLQIGMWATPIMWSYTIVPEKYQWIIKLNPMYYIVEGYRDTFINQIWFFNKHFQTIYFWVIALVIFGSSALIFKKLKPHFADVL
ncbi:ABC transporter permease [Sedimentibacter saalensis]|uniref:ABC transporter permease n=1 Tax=Sedimentibacter saalensis TaxID=130788 RepID=UPI002896CB66|nr:ABC transporter permease [Sedimentibacter saalensis]